MAPNWFRKKFDRWCYRRLPLVIDCLTDLANHRPAKLMAKAGATRIMVDNSVLGKAVAHETAWVSTGEVLWGGEIPIDTGYAARIPVHSPDADSRDYRSLLYLHALARLYAKGHIELLSSSELVDERYSQPAGRYGGYGLMDRSMLEASALKTVADPAYVNRTRSTVAGIGSRQERKERLETYQDPVFLGLRDALGKRNDQDAYHIAFAQRFDCYCFLTMDYKLIGALQAQKGHRAVKALTVQVLTPEMLGIRFGLLIVPTLLLSYHDASWAVEAAMYWGDSRRKGQR